MTDYADSMPTFSLHSKKKNALRHRNVQKVFFTNLANVK